MKVFISSINFLLVVVFAIICFSVVNTNVVFAADEAEVDEEASSSVNNAGVQPDEIHSKDGILDTILTVDYLLSLDGFTRYAPAYNGKSVGPTFRVKPGDKIKIKLINNLLPESNIGHELYKFVLDPDPVDTINQTIVFNRLNSNGISGSLLSYQDYWGKSYQNLHFHGLMINPNIEITNSFAIDGGGNEYTYEFNIPIDHVGGISFYHNHFHGTSCYSSLSGLFGAFIVETNNDPYITALQNNNLGGSGSAAEEIVLLFSESSTEIVDNGQPVPVNFIPIIMSFDWIALTNGKINPKFVFNVGTTIYFRTVNAGELPPVLLSIDNHTIYPIGADSSYPIPIPKTTTTDNDNNNNNDNEEEVDNTIVIDAGSRIEFAVKFDTFGTFFMRRGGYNFNIVGPSCAAFFGPELDGITTCISYDKDDIIGTIIVVSSSDDDDDDNNNNSNNNNNDIGDDEKTTTTTTTDVARDFNNTDDGNNTTSSLHLPILRVSPYLTKLLEQPMSKGTSKVVTMDLATGVPIFQIPYDGIFQPGGGTGINMLIGNPHHVLGNITAGTCEEWTIASNPPGLIPHTFHIHSVPFLVTSEHGIELDTPFWRDTYPVLDNITATVCFPPTDVGYMVNVHCHMPAHQDAGMFGMYEVLPSVATVETSTTNTVEGDDDTSGVAASVVDVDDADINEEKDSSATTATNESIPTMLFFALVFSSSFYFL